MRKLLRTNINKQGRWAITVTGRKRYLPHVIKTHSLTVRVNYGWTKQWWKPWTYLSFGKVWKDR